MALTYKVSRLTQAGQRSVRALRTARRWKQLPILAAALTSAPVVLAQWPVSAVGEPPNTAAMSQAVPSVGQILQQAANAAATLNYSGTITYKRRSAEETSRVVHLFENGVEMERVTTLDGPPFEVVRLNDELTYYLPERRVMRIEPRTGRQGFPSLLPRQMTTLAQHFTVKRLEIERVAGLDAQVWEFAPNDEKIGGKIDREQVKSTLADTIANWRVDRRLPVSAMKTDTGWFAKGLPAGFVKISENFMRALPGRTEPVSQLVYSDGLTSVSVYAAPLSTGELPVLGATVQGSHQVFSRQANDQLVTAFGDARPAAVKAIASSLIRK